MPHLNVPHYFNKVTDFNTNLEQIIIVACDLLFALVLCYLLSRSRFSVISTEKNRDAII